MILFDMIMKPLDSYWKKQYHAEAIRRRRAEANEKFANDTMEEQERSLDLLSRRDVGQARAIETLNREILRLKDELAEANKTIDARDEKIAVLWEALHAERDARAALKTSQRLWEEKRERIATAPAGLRNDTVDGNKKEAQG